MFGINVFGVLCRIIWKHVQAYDASLTIQMISSWQITFVISLDVVPGAEFSSIAYKAVIISSVKWKSGASFTKLFMTELINKT